jgi:hypothetical protein
MSGDNPSLKSNKVLIMEPDDQKYEKVAAIFKKDGKAPMQGKTYAECLSMVSRIVFGHVVCEYILTDPACFDFIGKVKELDYNHPNLIISTKDVIDRDESQQELANFINTADVQAKLDEILEGDFEEMDFSELNAAKDSYIHFSAKNKLPIETTYLFDLNLNEIYIGVKSQIEISEIGDTLNLDASFGGAKHEVKLRGTYEETDPFDEDKDSTYLLFKVGEDSIEEWKQILDEFEADEIDVVDLLMNVRGY